MSTSSRPLPRLVRAFAAFAVLLVAGLLVATTQPRPHAAVAADDTVVLAVYPDGQGSVTVKPAPIAAEGAVDDNARCAGSGDQGTACRFTYARGSTVTLDAKGDDGADAVLRGWSDVLCPGSAPCSLQLTDDEEYVAALFSPQAVKIRVRGEGTVTANGRPCVEEGERAPAEGAGAPAYVLSCGTFELLETVKLVAAGDRPVWDPVPADGSDRPILCEESPPAAPTTCTIVADRFRWLRLGFAGEAADTNLPQPSATRLKVRTVGMGTVTNPAKTISCPGRCSIPGSGGSKEVLIARGDPGWRFVRWRLCAPDADAANVCVARLGATVAAEFDRASGPSGSSGTPGAAGSGAALVGVTGRGAKRRVRFAVKLAAPGTVRASLIRGGRNYAKPYTRPFDTGAFRLSLGVKPGAPKGSYRLNVAISGAAPKAARFTVTLPR